MCPVRERPLLRSHKGCKRCRERRKKCDEVRPVCGACVRLKLPCSWPRSINEHFEHGSRITSLQRPPQNSKLPGDVYLSSYDDPSILQGSATSIVQDIDGKQAILYLCEVGAQFVRYPTRLFPGWSNLNSFRLGFQMASQSQPHIYAMTAIGAGHLAHMHEKYRLVALENYGHAMRHLRNAVLMSSKERPPSEQTCAVAALLAVYQRMAFDSARAKLVHLLGFFRLCQARIDAAQSWGPLQILFEHYIHALTIGTLFQFHAVKDVGSLFHVENLITKLNRGPRPLGKEIVGVPEKLTIAAFKLSYLNHQNVDTAPWTAELMAVSRLVRRWEPASHACKPSAQGLFVVGQLYWLACLCLLNYLEANPSNPSNPLISSYVVEAVEMVKNSYLVDKPFNTISWPLTVLGIFAERVEQRVVLIAPLKSLRDNIRLMTYKTAVEFLERTWQQGLGPSVLRNPELLSHVHL